MGARIIILVLGIGVPEEVFWVIFANVSIPEK
jgi:hypothetical protein